MKENDEKFVTLTRKEVELLQRVLGMGPHPQLVKGALGCLGDAYIDLRTKLKEGDKDES